MLLANYREIDPRRFGARQIELLRLAASAPEADDSVREWLLGEAAGNPLALLELPKGLSAAQLQGRAALPETAPLTSRLRSAFMQRIDRLPSETQTALVMAAVDESGGLAAIMGGNGIAASEAKLPGIILALSGAFGFALGTVFSKKYPIHLPPITAAATA